MTATPTGSWSRQRLATVLGIGVVAALTLLAGMTLALLHLGTGTTHQTGPVSVVTETGGDRRDQIAAEPMAEVNPDAGFTPDPALAPAPPILVPVAVIGRGPAGVPTGFPQTPQGAVAQLAAIEQTVLEAMSLPVTLQVHEAWVLPGGPAFQEWAMTDNVSSFLRSGQQGGQQKDVTTLVTATPAMAMVKGTDGPDWVVACVLLDVQVSIRADARMGYGHCSRMQWADGRWQIAPGPAPAKAPSAWPGSVAAVEAGWLTWQEAGS